MDFLEDLNTGDGSFHGTTLHTEADRHQPFMHRHFDGDYEFTARHIQAAEFN
ncbi:hypothetical protein TIFTF001_035970 [Ficus carica]|uniref:Uncharacterized protein n=1 Tax=Ficus carica TaxID=3494 RepID=A0AA88J736_FICCA|nr:hypothetical protein TIFTF001_035970 [Ficus carica]